MAVQPLIREDIEGQVFRVHRSAMTSPDVLKLERQRIFDRCWLYVGHESEVPNAGDYRRRKVGGRPLFFVRASDSNVRVFYNTCRHRGAMVCRQDQGNGEIFQCFYHAWTFNSRGELIGVPDEEGYAEGFNKADLSLLSPPNVDSYRGFIFICYDPHAMDLRSYLAGATEFIDLVADQSEAGMRVIRGSNRYSIQANWKLLVENSFDNYHVGPTHKTYIDYQTSLGVKILPQSERWSEAYSLGNGHAVMEFAATAGRPTARWSPLFGENTKEEIAAVRERLVQRYGEERTKRMADHSRNLLIYPNLFIIDVAGLTLRTFYPVSQGEIEIQAWEMVPGEDDEQLLRRRLDSFLTFLGPGGFATPDDSEALETCQAGFAADEVEWSDVSRGMHVEHPESIHELQLRTFWRQWHAHLQGEGWLASGNPETAAHGVNGKAGSVPVAADD